MYVPYWEKKKSFDAEETLSMYVPYWEKIKSYDPEETPLASPHRVILIKPLTVTSDVVYLWFVLSLSFFVVGMSFHV